MSLGFIVLICVLLPSVAILWVLLDREPAPGSLPVVTTAPTSPPKSTLAPTPPALETVRVHHSEASTTKVVAEIVFSDLAHIEITFEPVLHQVMHRSDGSASGASFQRLEDHSVAKMQVCTSLDRPCKLGEDWGPFESRHVLEVPVDGLGAREFWLAASFRDASGQIIPSLGRRSGEPGTISQSS